MSKNDPANKGRQIVGVPLAAEIIEQIDEHADREDRPRANMARVLIVEALRHRNEAESHAGGIQ